LRQKKNVYNGFQCSTSQAIHKENLQNDWGKIEKRLIYNVQWIEW